MEMIARELGNTGIRLSTMGLGTWAIGGGDYEYGWGPQDDKESIATIRKSIDLGINWIDTAPVYGLGHSEKIVGQAIKGIREKVYITTKCSFRWDENRKIFSTLKKESVVAEVEESLKRLNIDVIDFYLIHFPIPEEEVEEAWGVLADLEKQGKIRHAGVSNFTLEQLKKVQVVHPVSIIEPGYNIIQNDIEGGLLDYCVENGIGVVTFSSMYMGLLTGKYTKEKLANLPPDDSRSNEFYFKEPFLTPTLEMIERLRPIAERNGKTMAQLAIAWVLRQQGIASAIVGARSPEQIEQTVPAANWILSPEDRKDIDVIVNEYHELLTKLKSEIQDS